MPLRTRIGQIVKKLLRVGKPNDFFRQNRTRSPAAAQAEFEAQSRNWNGF